MDIFKLASFRVNAILLIMMGTYCNIMAVAETQFDEFSPIVDSLHRFLFAENIFKEVNVGKEENLIISPVSIQTCLALLLFGTGGKTEKEINGALRMANPTPTMVAENYEKFLDGLRNSSNVDDAVQFLIANRIYVNEGSQINPKFNEIAAKAFKTQAEQVNFADSKNAVKKINQFVEDQTEHKIKDLLPVDSVNQNTKVVLVNALHLRGQWKTPFDPVKTHKSDFFYGNKKVQVDTMRMTTIAGYVEHSRLDFKLLELPYARSNLSMLIFLPNSIDGLQKLEEILTGNAILFQTNFIKYQAVDISIPKFRIETDLDLIEPLKRYGVEEVFQKGKANLTALFENPQEEYVTDVKHKAVIELNEAGTSVAAGVKAINIEPSSEVLQNAAVFNANHPFMFVVKGEEAFYLIGHVVKFDE